MNVHDKLAQRSQLGFGGLFGGPLYFEAQRLSERLSKPFGECVSPFLGAESRGRGRLSPNRGHVVNRDRFHEPRVDIESIQRGLVHLDGGALQKNRFAVLFMRQADYPTCNISSPGQMQGYPGDLHVLTIELAFLNLGKILQKNPYRAARKPEERLLR